MRVLVAIDLSDDNLTEAYGMDPRTATMGHEWDDLFVSLGARFSEFYCGAHDTPVQGRIVTMGDFTGDDALRDLLDAAEVGTEGIDDEYRRGHVTGSLVTMRQFLDNDAEEVYRKQRAVWPANDEERASFRDWKLEVSNGDTAIGFRDWLANQEA